MYVLIKEMGLSTTELICGCLAFGFIVLLEVYLLYRKKS